MSEQKASDDERPLAAVLVAVVLALAGVAAFAFYSCRTHLETEEKLRTHRYEICMKVHSNSEFCASTTRH